MTIEAGAPRHYTAADIPTGFPRTADGIINRHGIRLIREFEGPPRLKARLCEGGRFELGPGVTFHLNWASVEEGETCDEAYGEALFAHALQKFSAAVDRLVKVDINSNQHAAYTAFTYNVGEANFASSTVLRKINERRYDDAAEAMGAWVYATLGRHKQALRGLARRQYATGCLAMGYDWAIACSDDAVALVRERPPGDIGTDRVLFKTPFKDVLLVAQRYELPADGELVLSQPEPSPRAVAVEAAQRQPDPARSPAAAGVAPAKIEKPAAVSPAPGAAVKSEVPQTLPPQVPAVIPKAAPALPKDAAPADLSNPKDMLLSRRAWGLAVTAIGTTQFIPRGASEWINNENNRELLSWLLVVIAGVLLYQYGKWKAKRPLK